MSSVVDVCQSSLCRDANSEKLLRKIAFHSTFRRVEKGKLNDGRGFGIAIGFDLKKMIDLLRGQT